jgi:pimeloyl-ACP methyl ester carboxylesterase
MDQTAVSTQVFMQTIACADIRADVPKIACPTLVITTDGSGLASVEETTAWQRMIPLSELVVLPGNSYHAAASHPVEWSVHGPTHGLHRASLRTGLSLLPVRNSGLPRAP